MAEVMPATSPAEVREAVLFRLRVLGTGPGETRTGDAYDRDPTTIHCLVRNARGECVGAGRLIAPLDTHDGGELVAGNPVLGPIVVAESVRGRGVGRAILTFLEEEALAAYGRNGTVRVEAWIPPGMAVEAGAAGYTIQEGGGAAQGASTQVFRDIVVNTIRDSRKGPAVA